MKSTWSSLPATAITWTRSSMALWKKKTERVIRNLEEDLKLRHKFLELATYTEGFYGVPVSQTETFSSPTGRSQEIISNIVIDRWSRQEIRQIPVDSKVPPSVMRTNRHAHDYTTALNTYSTHDHSGYSGLDARNAWRLRTGRRVQTQDENKRRPTTGLMIPW